mgnify:CR=1 FL=1
MLSKRQSLEDYAFGCSGSVDDRCGHCAAHYNIPMYRKRITMRSTKALIGSLGITILTFTCADTALAGLWGTSSKSKFGLDANVVCEAPNYSGEYVTDPGVG